MTTDFRKATPWSEQRASHADRERAVRCLQQATVEGRLDFHELDERLEQALGARTHGELAVLTADLQATEGEGRDAEPDRPPVLRGGLHGAVRKGRWKVPPRLTAYGGMGGVVLDFTQADCRLRTVDIEAHGQMAGVTIVVPDDWSVDTDRIEPGLGGITDRTTPDHAADAPHVRLTGNGGMAGIVVRHPKPRERRRLERERKALASG
ncbi:MULTISPECIES: DUF1707 domain-containing protein [Streptomyces]|uniref:DUF1707 domain-containing protein n=1 Tax=Streptomyces luteosporeus TaxID=173856 RepID=A0ABP6GPR7_9ACTN